MTNIKVIDVTIEFIERMPYECSKLFDNLIPILKKKKVLETMGQKSSFVKRIRGRNCY